MVVVGLLVADSDHEEGNVSEDINWEFLNGDKELGPFGYLDGTVDLEV